MRSGGRERRRSGGQVVLAVGIPVGAGILGHHGDSPYLAGCCCLSSGPVSWPWLFVGLKGKGARAGRCGGRRGKKEKEEEEEEEVTEETEEETDEAVLETCERWSRGRRSGTWRWWTW